MSGKGLHGYPVSISRIAGPHWDGAGEPAFDFGIAGVFRHYPTEGIGTILRCPADCPELAKPIEAVDNRHAHFGPEADNHALDELALQTKRWGEEPPPLERQPLPFLQQLAVVHLAQHFASIERPDVGGCLMTVVNAAAAGALPELCRLMGAFTCEQVIPSLQARDPDFKRRILEQMERAGVASPAWVSALRGDA